MTRIFLVLASLANGLLIVTLVLGLQIGDARSPEAATTGALGVHFLVALGTAILVLLVHAVVLTYFMGTGRWIEETSAAYQLGEEPRRQNIRLKYRVLPGMVLCIGLVVATGALGAIADPASHTKLAGAATIHFWLAAATLAVNLTVSWIEWDGIHRNARIVNEVIDAVRRIRRERGLDAPPDASASSSDRS